MTPKPSAFGKTKCHSRKRSDSMSSCRPILANWDVRHGFSCPTHRSVLERSMSLAVIPSGCSASSLERSVLAATMLSVESVCVGRLGLRRSSLISVAMSQGLRFLDISRLHMRYLHVCHVGLLDCRNPIVATAFSAHLSCIRPVTGRYHSPPRSNVTAPSLTVQPSSHAGSAE